MQNYSEACLTPLPFFFNVSLALLEWRIHHKAHALQLSILLVAQTYKGNSLQWQWEKLRRTRGAKQTKMHLLSSFTAALLLGSFYIRVCMYK